MTQPKLFIFAVHIIACVDVPIIYYMCVCYWPLVHEVYRNHDVVMFLPWIVTTRKPILCQLLLYSLIMNPPHPLLLPSNLPPGRNPNIAPPTHVPASTLSSYGIICPPGQQPSPSQHTKNTSPTPHPLLSDSDSSSPSLLPPCLPDSC